MRASQIHLVETKLIPFYPISKVQKVNVFKRRKVITMHIEHSAQKLNFAFWLADSVFICQNKGRENKENGQAWSFLKVQDLEFLWEYKIGEKTVSSEPVRNQKLIRIMKEICGAACLHCQIQRMKL